MPQVSTFPCGASQHSAEIMAATAVQAVPQEKKATPERLSLKIELLESISEDSPIKKYISKHGQGMHHLALIVENIEDAIDYFQYNFQFLEAGGYRSIVHSFLSLSFFLQSVDFLCSYIFYLSQRRLAHPYLEFLVL